MSPAKNAATLVTGGSTLEIIHISRNQLVATCNASQIVDDQKPNMLGANRHIPSQITLQLTVAATELRCQEAECTPPCCWGETPFVWWGQEWQTACPLLTLRLV